ncbi:MAG: hypothetical protein ACKOEO_08845 [Planctomycetaceae bacterium]
MVRLLKDVRQKVELLPYHERETVDGESLRDSVTPVTFTALPPIGPQAGFRRQAWLKPNT